MNAPSNNNQYWLLNSVSGWRMGAPATDIFQNESGSLTLQTLPGEAQPFVPDLTGKLTCPAALCRDVCGGTWILDAAINRVLRVDPAGTVRTIDQFGGPGAEPRQFNAPRGLAMVNGRVVVCDTGNHRVQVFSPAPYALIQLWGRADASAGAGPLEFRWPWGVVADAVGNLYVADRGNARVQKISLEGDWLADIGVGVLKEPTELALSPHGDVAVVDGTTQENGGTVLLFSANGGAPTSLDKIVQPRAVAFDEIGNLYIGSATGLVYHFTLDPNVPGGYANVGPGMTGLSASAVGLTWVADKGLLGIFQDAEKLTRALWWIPPDGAFVTYGQYYTTAIDSGIEDCAWDRISLVGSIPTGSSVKVECFTSPQNGVPLTPNAGDGPSYTFGGDSSGLTCIDPTCGDPTCQDPKCGGVADREMTYLVQALPGQFLRLRLTFTSVGQSTPRINAIKVYFPRQSYLQYLPAVYQEDPDSRAFLDRFLSLFQATFDDFGATIDSMWRLFDADSVPPQYFDWLTAWLQQPIDPKWTLAKKREMLAGAAKAYRKRGTVAGIVQAVKDYAGISDGVALVEHFRLRNWSLLPTAAPLGGEARLWGRQFYRRLQVGRFSQIGSFALTDRPEPAAEANDWGANEFSLFYPADPYDPGAATAKVRAVVEREKPAHTKANYVPVLPRFRVGVQATIGVDTRVGGYTQLVLGRVSTLGYDTILARSHAQRDLELLGASVQPITGVNTTLF